MTTAEISSPALDKTPAAKSGRQRGVWWVAKWSLAILGLMIVVIVLLNFRMRPGKASPLVRVSPQTTWIISPLKPNGDVDYRAFLNQQLAVPPDKNALVPLVDVIGTKPMGGIVQPLFWQLLGIRPPASGRNYLENVKRKPKVVTVDVSATINGVELDAQEVFDLTLDVPFAPGEFPGIEKWFAANEHHLLAVRDAVRLPGYYHPVDGEAISMTTLPYIQEMREVAHSLQRSSMLRLGKGDVDGAINDQIAILRLARHVGSQGFLVELINGTAIEGIGHEALSQTIFSGQCSATDLKKMIDELDALPIMPLMNLQHRETERAMQLDLAINFGRFGPFLRPIGDVIPATPNSGADDPGFLDGFVRTSVDWESACLKLNAWFDRIELDLKGNGLVEQLAASKALDLELNIRKQEMEQTSGLLQSVLKSRRGRGELAAEKILLSGHATMSSALEYLLKATAQNRLTRIAVAVQLYRVANKVPPPDLDSLVPSYLESVPLDPYTQLPMSWQVEPDGTFRLFSVGLDGKGDSGVGMKEMWVERTDLHANPAVRSVQEWIDANRSN